jgi:NAD(P)-dependent dehydrogenase (short-subunit alcohol dehydrogenase family)
MNVAASNDLLRSGLLTDVSLLLAGAPAAVSQGAGSAETTKPIDAALGRAVATICTSLGARVAACGVDATEEAALDGVVASEVERAGGIDLLAVDGAALFAHGLAPGRDGHVALRACLDGAWNATRAVVNNAFLRAAEPRGRVVYLAPTPDADQAELGRHAPAAIAGLENLARTLSIEWARYAITAVTIAPGVETAAGEVAALVAYLASPAGAYFSGCLLDLRGARAA